MQHFPSPHGIRISYDRSGDGPPLVLVHGSFSDHRTNWAFVKPFLESRFTVYALARRGRGLTEATHSHAVEDEIRDVIALIGSIDEPVYLLGHSYGAQVALGAAAGVPERVRKLVLYEPPCPSMLRRDLLERLEERAAAGDWEGVPATFFHEALSIPMEELDELRASEHWAPIVADAQATLEEMRAMSRYTFDADRYADLDMPVLLQVGTRSPRDRFVTDALAAVLPDCRIEAFPDQAHEAMTMAPREYAEAVVGFLVPRE